jgi:hypothetical protein
MGEVERGEGMAGRYIWGGGGGDENASKPKEGAGEGNTVNIVKTLGAVSECWSRG